MSPKLNNIWIVIRSNSSGFDSIQAVFHTEDAAENFIKESVKHAFWVYRIEPYTFERNSRVPEIRE